jgi:sugar phosphate isomerase/epimerase
VLRSPEQRAVVAKAAAHALAVIEPVYGMTRPSAQDTDRRARTNRAIYELHDRAGEFTSVLFTQKRYPTASELLLGGSIFPAMQNFLLAARAQGLGACMTSWASYGGEQLLRDADLTCELAGALGASYYVIIDGITPDREQTAGRSEDAVRLDRVAWRTLTDTVGRVAEIAADHGLVAAFHPHAGTRVEFRDEIERLLGDTDPSLVHLCVDTGHSTYAGIDPVELCRSHAARLAYVHLKDVTLPVLERARLDKVGFWEAYRRGVFCVLGRGSVDFVGLRDCLRDLRYDGWLTVEQDASPTGHSVPLEDAMASRKFLADTGFGAFRSDADPGGRK